VNKPQHVTSGRVQTLTAIRAEEVLASTQQLHPPRENYSLIPGR